MSAIQEESISAAHASRGGACNTEIIKFGRRKRELLGHLDAEDRYISRHGIIHHEPESSSTGAVDAERAGHEKLLTRVRRESYAARWKVNIRPGSNAVF